MKFVFPILTLLSMALFANSYCQSIERHLLLNDEAREIKIELEFQFTPCITLQLDKTETFEKHNSSYKIRSNKSNECTVHGSFTYQKCNGEEITTHFLLKLNSMTVMKQLPIEFTGAKLIRVNKGTLFECEEIKLEEKINSKKNENANIQSRSKQRDTTNQIHEFYYFITFPLTINSKTVTIFSHPLYHKGDLSDDLSKNTAEFLKLKTVQALIDDKNRNEFEKLISNNYSGVDIVKTAPYSRELLRTRADCINARTSLIQLLEQKVSDIKRNIPENNNLLSDDNFRYQYKIIEEPFTPKPITPQHAAPRG